MTPLHSFAPGGVERVALRLCGTWANDPALAVQIVMGRATGEMRDEAPADVMLHVTPEPFPTAAWESLWMMLTLPGHIRRLRPDVLFAAGNSYAVIAVAMKLWFGNACPPIVLKISNDLVRRDMNPVARTIYHWWLRIQGRMIDHVTGLAEPMRAEIAAYMAMPAARIHIIDDPAMAEGDHAALMALGAARTARSDSGRHYVGIGRLARQKNWPLLVDAFARMAGPLDRLSIIGEGGERPAIERRIAALGLLGRVALPGHSAVPPVLAAADVFVLSSDFEGVPAVVIEALTSGLPVVATDCSVSMPSLVRGHGQIVPVGDATALAIAMASQQPLSADRRAAAAADMARFTVQRAASAYAALFGLASGTDSSPKHS